MSIIPHTKIDSSCDHYIGDDEIYNSFTMTHMFIIINHMPPSSHTNLMRALF
jgi:hypothetical protein